jgi:hypothetical protein
MLVSFSEIALLDLRKLNMPEALHGYGARGRCIGWVSRPSHADLKPMKVLSGEIGELDMTDHPRFWPVNAKLDCCYCDYHGARLVSLVFRLVDLWLGRVPIRRHLSGMIYPAIAISALLVNSVQLQAQDYQRLRGTIEASASGVYTVRTRDGNIVQLKLADNVTVAASVRSAISDIKAGQYIGIAAMPQLDGSLQALEAHIFDESMRGTAEGHRSWDLLPNSTMTNAAVHDIVRAVHGHSVTLRYKDGEQRIIIPPATPVVTYFLGTVSELKPGARIFVPAAMNQPDGALLAARVMVGRDAPPPQ